MKWLSSLILLMLVSTVNISDLESGNTKIADVLIYSGAGAGSEGIVAFEKFLDLKGLTWLECDDTYIENNNLVDDFDVIHFPGGNSGYYVDDINSIGLQHIRDFISAGGGYIGICAGGYFACDRIVWEGSTYDHPLDLFSGVGYGAIDEIAPWPNYAMTTITINTSNPINRYESSSEYILYSGGAAFYPDEGQEMNVIGTYDLLNDDPAMINFRYGDGRVILFGPHPELEEDSTRDGVVFGDDLLDLGTDWDLLWTCMDWLMGVPISEPPVSLPPCTPSIIGPESGKTGWKYSYTFASEDPEEEELYYWVDWGDNTTSDWIGPYNSGEKCIASYCWSEKGNYNIKVKTKDSYGLESRWSDPLPIVMPYSYEPTYQFFDWLFQRFPNTFQVLWHLMG